VIENKNQILVSVFMLLFFLGRGENDLRLITLAKGGFKYKRTDESIIEKRYFLGRKKRKDIRKKSN